jgi:hypothetical protein
MYVDLLVVGTFIGFLLLGRAAAWIRDSSRWGRPPPSRR